MLIHFSFPKKRGYYRSKIAAEVSEEVNGNIDPEDVNLLMIANILTYQGVSSLFLNLNLLSTTIAFQNIDDALRALHLSESLECRAATIQCLLKIDRVDLAM